MHAEVGDKIRIDSRSTDVPRREGEVVEVRGEPGHEHYIVRWDDGHTSTFFPGSDAHIEHTE